MMAVGMVLIMFTQLNIFIPLVLIGLVLFASFPTEDLFCDYVMANSEQALVRKRYYVLFIPVALVAKILTLGKANLLIPYKEEYFVVNVKSQSNAQDMIGSDAETSPEYKKITRKEYKALLKEQRNIYSTQTLSKDFMEKNYTIKDIGLKHKKRRLIAAGVMTAITAVLFFDPDPMAWILSGIYEVVYLPMTLLWIAPYRDAKILQKAYDRAVNN